MQNSRLLLGIDMGGTRTKAAVVDAAGKIVRNAQSPSPMALDECTQKLHGMLKELQTGLPPISAVGIGCKGIIDPETTCVVTLPGTQHYLEGLRLSEIIAPVLPPGCPVTADNDARVALAGEHQWGSANGCHDVLMLTLGTGIGGAVLCRGQILHGAKGIAGHIGHLTVDSDGPVCICGNRGCLETFFSAAAIEGEIWAGLHRGLPPNLGARPTCQQIFEAARQGDTVARHVIDRGIKYLGGAIAGLIFVLDPEKVILTGQMIESADLFLETLTNDIHQRTFGLLRRNIPIVPSSLSDPSGVIGAAALALALLPS